MAELFDLPSDAVASGVAQKEETADFWGNPVSPKKKKKSTAVKKTAKKEATDFWGETVKTSNTKIKPKSKPATKKKKSNSKEDDFWGEKVPVKKKNN
jgi:hypothetical protein